MYFQITPISRGHGRGAVGAAAYRSGERIRDERTGKLHNYSHRDDIPHKEILLPAGLNTERIPWVRNRAQLWNVAERAEHQRNSRVAREFQLGLPHELSAEQRLNLARVFSQELSDRYRVVVDLAVHLPRKGGDPRNHHAHLMLTSREITDVGFGSKAGLDLQPGQMQVRGLREGIAEIKHMRKRWATVANEALREANVDERVDHRTLADQGIDRLPRARVPWSTVVRERKGLRSEIGDRVRANHMARVLAKKQKGLNPPAAAPAADPPKPTFEDLQRQSREAWTQLRRGDAQSQDGKTLAQDGKDPGQDSKKSTQGRAGERSLKPPALDDDLSL
jgi:ATP-dependent exoDNAse (exonuclease V) alpha subunit